MSRSAYRFCGFGVVEVPPLEKTGWRAASRAVYGRGFAAVPVSAVELMTIRVHLLRHGEPYLKVIREKCSDALHILDRFHIDAKMNKALDEVRAGESGRTPTEGRTPLLKNSRWLLLKRQEKLKWSSASACATCSGMT